MRWTSIVVASVVLTGWAIADDSPEFEFSFDCRDRRLLIGSPENYEVECRLRSASPLKGPGATGWSFAVSGRAVGEWASISLVGTAADSVDDGGFLGDDGFAWAELTQGHDGAVVAVTLSGDGGTTLPATGSWTVARLEFAYPGRGVHSSSLSFGTRSGADGDPVRSVVHWQGQEIVPVLEPCRFELGSFGEQHGVVFQRESLYEVPLPFAGRIEGPLQVLPGRAQVFAAISSDLPSILPQGSDGWSLSIAVEGDLSLVGATTSGTAAASSDEPGGRRLAGFEKTELVDPALPRDVTQGHGVVSAVVLGFTNENCLEAYGTATVLSLSLEGEPGQRGRIYARDGLVGSGQPMENLSTIMGSSGPFGFFDELEVEFLSGFPFIRGDINRDARVQMSDAVSLLGFLFADAATPCLEASDANSDARVDVSDAIFLLSHMFLGGEAPAAPFEQCGYSLGGTGSCQSASCPGP
ncbi:MAG: hypothetical protein AAF517_05230 [Planctomycetota bacterium]